MSKFSNLPMSPRKYMLCCLLGLYPATNALGLSQMPQRDQKAIYSPIVRLEGERVFSYHLPNGFSWKTIASSQNIGSWRHDLWSKLRPDNVPVFSNPGNSREALNDTQKLLQSLASFDWKLIKDIFSLPPTLGFSGSKVEDPVKEHLKTLEVGDMILMSSSNFAPTPLLLLFLRPGNWPEAPRPCTVFNGTNL